MVLSQMYSSSIDVNMIYHTMRNHSWYDAVKSVNPPPATITSYLIPFVEWISTVIALMPLLKNDVMFRMDCEFRIDDLASARPYFFRLIA